MHRGHARTAVVTLALLAVALGVVAAPPRHVEVILDASGSMAGRLADGTSKIAGAQRAVERLAAGLPADLVVALRAYGHASPKEQHDCKDTALLVPFGPASGQRAAVTAQAKALTPRGWTPITWVLQTAAADFPAAASERVIVLVSDGKETCDGDPCALARALAAGRPPVVIHTIGFAVDDAARLQLACIAAATGGRTFDAATADQLAAVLATAVTTAGTRPETKTGQGWLEVRHPELSGHAITDAATGARVDAVSATRATAPLPAGIYNVAFGPVLWKSVEVKGGETTVLDPGVLEVEGASFRGHDVVDAETGVKHATVSSSDGSATLIPGTYEVTFGAARWRDVVVRAGGRTVLEPGIVEVRGATINGHAIRDADGRVVGEVSATGNSMPLPPGRYEVKLAAGWRAVKLAAGQRAVLENR